MDTPFQIARHTLVSPGFLRDRSDVRRLREVNGVAFPDEIDVLEFKYRSLAGDVLAGLVLAGEQLARGSIRRLEPRLRSWLAARNMFALCESDAIIEELLEVAPHVQPFADANELFRAIIAIPQNLAGSLMMQATGDFSVSRFSATYHPRTATIVSSPSGILGDPGERLSLDEYFSDWTCSEASFPVLILGDRGSGKTWELLHLAALQVNRHSRDPWRFAPALYMPLSHLRGFFEPPGKNIPTISGLLLERYRDIRPAFGDETFSRLFDTGHVIACLDGVDELTLTPTDRQACDAFARLLSEVAPSTKLIVTARESHFPSRQDLLNTRIFDASTVADQFLVLKLDSFTPEAVREVASSTAKILREKDVTNGEFRVVPELLKRLRSSASSKAALNAVVDALLKHPALLTEIVRVACADECEAREWGYVLSEVLDNVTLGFNILEDKTSDVFDTEGRSLINLGVTDRLFILEEFAHTLAMRGVDRLSPEVLAARLEVLIDVKSSDVMREFRTHTLLELGGDRGTFGELQFCYDLPCRNRLLSETAPESESIIGGTVLEKTGQSFERLCNEALARAPVGVTSVAGARCLASWAHRRFDVLAIEQAAKTPSLGNLEELFSVLGLVPFGPIAGSWLESLLRDRHGSNYDEQVRPLLRRAALTLFRGLARHGGLRLFSPRIRYLGHNLEAVNVLDSSERQRLDPWTGNIIAFAEGRKSSESPSLVLVPPIADEALVRRFVGQISDADTINSIKSALSRPYLLGVTEVTNQQFLKFLRSEVGQEWSIDRVTRAGSGGDNESPAAAKTNEYHLYLWEDHGEDGYRPPLHREDHPVTYVSWYAAEAYCNWLSLAQAPSNRGQRDVRRSQQKYRLPTAAEWLWAAQGGYPGVEYPWEIYGRGDACVHASGEGQLDVSESLARVMDIEAQRERIRQNVLHEEKDTRQVGTEVISSFGVFGIVGNVKEWAYDKLRGLPASRQQNLILGGSSNLGPRSFSFRYYSSLFPQNTNPDVGFRICRHLTDEELNTLLSVEQTIGRFNDPELLADL